MSARLILAVLGGVLLLAPVVELTSTAAVAQSAVVVKVGGSKSIPVSDVSRVSVTNPEVADIRVEGGKQVKITGRAPGSTTVVVWLQDGQKVSWSVTVTP